MKNKLDNNLPIYQQIVNDILRTIANGELEPGEKVAPVRLMALYYGVNPNTAQKALEKLVDMGFMFTESTSGRFVTEDAAAIEGLKSKLSDKIVGDFIQDMKGLGIEEHDVPKYVNEYIGRLEINGKNTGN